MISPRRYTENDLWKSSMIYLNMSNNPIPKNPTEIFSPIWQLRLAQMGLWPNRVPFNPLPDPSFFDYLQQHFGNQSRSRWGHLLSWSDRFSFDSSPQYSFFDYLQRFSGGQDLDRWGRLLGRSR